MQFQIHNTNGEINKTQDLIAVILDLSTKIWDSNHELLITILERVVSMSVSKALINRLSFVERIVLMTALFS